MAFASGTGNKIILFGARTGLDGIGGVSVLASETFDADGPAKRPSVQVGDPFMEKLLIECTLELFAAKVVAGIQDLGGAGLDDAAMRAELQSVVVINLAAVALSALGLAAVVTGILLG